MRRNAFLFVVGMLISMMSLHAQEVETIYYDSDFQVVKLKEFAEYYRVVEAGDTYPKSFADYYSTGEKFRTGGKLVLVDADGTVGMEGDVKQFYKNGKLHSAARFVAGKIEGVFTEFMEDGRRYTRMFENGNPTEKWGYLSDVNGNMSRVDDNGNIYHPALDEKDRINVLSGGQLWQSYDDGSVCVAAQLHPIREYGKYYRLDIFFSNHSLETVELDPLNTKMTQNDKKGERVSVRRVSGNEFKNKIDKRNRKKGFWYAVAQGVAASAAGESYSSTATNFGELSYNSSYSKAGTLYGGQVAKENIDSYYNTMYGEMSVLSDDYLMTVDVDPGSFVSGFVLFENNSKEEALVSVSVNGQEYKFRFNDLDELEFGSWAPVNEANNVTFSLALSPMVSRFLEDGGSKAEITGYESSIIENLNASQSNLVFKKTGCRYSVIMEVVSADEDDAELSGWMYLYDNKSLEKIAAAKIKAEGGKGSSFNLRLEKSLKKAAKHMLSVLQKK